MRTVPGVPHTAGSLARTVIIELVWPSHLSINETEWEGLRLVVEKHPNYWQAFVYDPRNARSYILKSVSAFTKRRKSR